ncbi:MAG: hypothetical protein DRP11_00325, partial [Candidatus Aenigmatarchaeota archaeon]
NYSDPWDPERDALDDAVLRLINRLDSDNNGRSDVELDSNDVEIISSTIRGVPFLWGPNLFTLKIWAGEPNE